MSDQEFKRELDSHAQILVEMGRAPNAQSARVQKQFTDTVEAVAKQRGVDLQSASKYLSYSVCSLMERQGLSTAERSRVRRSIFGESGLTTFAPDAERQASAPADAPALKDLFPWPPPTPSTRRSFSPDVTRNAAPARTVGDVASRLEQALKDGQFDTWGYYRAPGGFALVTRIERLDGNGMPLPGAARWTTQLAYAGLSFSSIFAVSRPKGYYRILVFILTDDPPMTKNMASAETFKIASRWALEGRSSLPAAVREATVTANHKLVLLVYEFERVQGGETTIFRPSRWPVDRHIQSLGFHLKPQQ